MTARINKVPRLPKPPPTMFELTQTERMPLEGEVSIELPARHMIQNCIGEFAGCRVRVTQMGYGGATWTHTGVLVTYDEVSGPKVVSPCDGTQHHVEPCDVIELTVLPWDATSMRDMSRMLGRAAAVACSAREVAEHQRRYRGEAKDSRAKRAYTNLRSAARSAVQSLVRLGVAS